MAGLDITLRRAGKAGVKETGRRGINDQNGGRAAGQRSRKSHVALDGQKGTVGWETKEGGGERKREFLIQTDREHKKKTVKKITWKKIFKLSMDPHDRVGG